MMDTEKMDGKRKRIRDAAVAACLGACILGGIFWFARAGVPGPESLIEAAQERIAKDNPLGFKLVAVEIPSWKRLDAETFEGDAFLVLEAVSPIYTMPHISGLSPYIDEWKKARDTLAGLTPFTDISFETEGALRRSVPENPFAKELFSLCRYKKGDTIRLSLFLQGKREDGRITEMNVPGLSAFPEIRKLREDANAYAAIAATAAMVDVTTPEFAEKSRAFAEAANAFASRVAAIRGERLSALLGTAMDPGTCYFQGEYGLLIKKRDFAKGTVQGREIFLDSKKQTAFTGRLVLKQDGGKQRAAMVFVSSADKKERTVFIGAKVLYIRVDGDAKGVAFLAPPEEAQRVLAKSGLGLELPAIW